MPMRFKREWLSKQNKSVGAARKFNEKKSGLNTWHCVLSTQKVIYINLLEEFNNLNYNKRIFVK